MREGSQIYRRRCTGRKIKIEKRREKEVKRERERQTARCKVQRREREGHPIDIRYCSRAIAFSCGRAHYTSIYAHTYIIWFYLWLPKLQVAGRRGRGGDVTHRYAGEEQPIDTDDSPTRMRDKRSRFLFLVCAADERHR